MFTAHSGSSTRDSASWEPAHPSLPLQPLNEVEQEAERMGEPKTRGRRALAALHQHMPDVMERHWREIHADLRRLDIKFARKAELAAAAGDGESSSNRPRPVEGGFLILTT
jgi:hypothetical protein